MFAIGVYAFSSCTNLDQVSIGTNTTFIGYGAFAGCIKLDNITIPSSVIEMASDVFSGCLSLRGVYFRGNQPNLQFPSLFNDVSDVKSFYLPGSTGWSEIFADRPTQLWNPEALIGDPKFGIEAGKFGFTVTGCCDIVVVIEACADLNHPVWEPVGTNTLTTGSFYFSDGEWISHMSRVYRFRSP